MNSGTVLDRTERFATMTSGTRVMLATGAMSRLRLKLSFSYNEVLIAFRQWQGGWLRPPPGAPTTDWGAIWDLPPGRFSMTTGWPSRSDSHWPIRRATISNPPPGGHRQSNARAATDSFAPKQSARP